MKLTLTNKFTNWEKFRMELDQRINLKVRLKTADEIETQINDFIEAIRESAKVATPEIKNNNNQETTYPLEVRNLITERRRARRIWHQSRHSLDKNVFNRINDQLKEIKRKTFRSYLEGLSPSADSEFSLWKATRKM